ncbi:hypothetical protein GJ633_12650 [Halorubrum sp. CBA1125]|nr:hypothetical protein [Halorubrum sp. CBA1125]
MRTNEGSRGCREAIKATIVRYDDRPDECTLYVASPVEGKRTTEWMTASRGGYVSLGMWR